MTKRNSCCLKIDKLQDDIAAARGIHQARPDVIPKNQADRAISTGKLHALLRFHTQPINVMVYHGSDRDYWS